MAARTQVIVALVSMSALALSLEPIVGYRPPASSSSSQYLPPRQQQPNRYATYLPPQQQQLQPVPPPSNDYLPPALPSTSRPPSSTPPVEYLPPRSDGPQFVQPVRQPPETTASPKYEFEYRVSDEFGNDFGHKESRAAGRTRGVYSVLLPDGRKQVVHYEADENGFKPRITYEEAASVLAAKAPLPRGPY